MSLFDRLFAAGASLTPHARDGGAGDAYRGDIDGLRAIAVLAVIVFHAGIVGFDGGFVGVDVFFVISGYLIGQILVRDIEARKFSLITFYERRVRRIIPALMAMMLATMLAGAALLMPRDFKELTESGLAASTFLSNVYFYLRADYFDTSAYYKPLLHTWSLAVEEQYYVVFPILLWALKRFLPGFTFGALALCAAASFAYCVFQTADDPNGAFYLPAARMWELLLGALLAVRPPPAMTPALREGSALAGLALILGSIFLLNEHMAFPGVIALAPVAGSALLIAAASQGFVGRVLASAPMRGVGLISYSLYLWHWPIMSLLRYYYQRETPLWAWVAAIAALFVISYLSWRFIEVPVRQNRAVFTRWRLFAGAAVTSAAFIALGVVGFVTRGLPQRLPDEVTRIANGTFDTNPRVACDQLSIASINAGEVCLLGDREQTPSFAFVGDSIANSMAPGVDEAARSLGISGAVLTYSGCYTLVETRQNTDFCSRQMQAFLDYIERTPSIQTVILLNRWSSAAEASRFGEDLRLNWNFIISDAQSAEAGPEENRRVLERGLARTLEALAPRRVIVAAYVPEQPFDVPRRNGLQTWLGRPLQPGVPRDVFEARQANVREILARLLRQHDFEVLDLSDHLCDVDFCRGLSLDGSALYSDDNHVSTTGAVHLAPVFAEALRNPDSPQPAAGSPPAPQN
ncbi:MAG: acyltransferase family protein [Hyphomonadaceae bacterium]